MPSQHAQSRTAVTFRLDGEILAAAKRAAGERGETMTDVVEDALAAYAGVEYVIEHDCEGNTFFTTGVVPSVARRRVRELRSDDTVSNVVLILRATTP